MQKTSESVIDGVSAHAEQSALLEPPVSVGDFEQVYRAAAGDASQIPWCDGRANPSLVAWMNARAPHCLRPGARIAVVGCGLGDDVAELTARGYDVTGFDVAPTAVQWAQKNHPTLATRFRCADLLNLPSNLIRRFDLVVEIYTMQALDPSLRKQAMTGVVTLARPHGVILVICRGRDEGAPLDGPPYPFSRSELLDLASQCGLAPTGSVDEYFDDEDPPQHRLRVALQRC